MYVCICVQWVVRITDDTFTHLPNLLDYLRHFDPKKKWYMGEKYERPGHLYADGGAGWIISRAVLEVVAPRRQEFTGAGGGCYDDVHFGHWLRDVLRIPLYQV